PSLRASTTRTLESARCSASQPVSTRSSGRAYARSEMGVSISHLIFNLPRCLDEAKGRSGRLEQLHRVAGGIVDKHLLAAKTGNDLASKVGSGRFQLRYRRFDVGHFHLEAEPAAGCRGAAVRHRLASAPSSAR